ncbi:MAG: universal stress protein [Desulfosoma sp.]|uniref:universal stress protein n=1 Tax=Desulfosoma sp. TaxID=2603217 RepID=UPI00404A69D7
MARSNHKCFLVAADGSERCLGAAKRFGQFFKDRGDCHWTILHCVQQHLMLYPGEIWDAETSLRVAKATQQKICQSITNRYREALLELGFEEDAIDTVCRLDSWDPGQEILKVAEERKIPSIAVGRRGLSPAENILIGSVSSRVVQYEQYRTVWIMDPEAPPTGHVLIAVESHPECRALTYYVNEWIGPTPGKRYTFLHILPPFPPALWDDGHILDEQERTARHSWKRHWEEEKRRQVDQFMDEAREVLRSHGIPDSAIECRILPMQKGVAWDLLAHMESGHYEAVVMGKRSLREKKPFLLGSHANKVLQHARKVHLCLVGRAC